MAGEPSASAGGGDRLALTGIYGFERDLSRRLLTWSAASVLVGVLLAVSADAFLRGFGIQALAWGAIDGLLALAGRRGALKKAGRPGAGEPGPQAVEARKLARLLWLNTGLDVLYVAAGATLVGTLGTGDGLLAGTGWGIAVQGAFLFGFDLLHALRLPKHH